MDIMFYGKVIGTASEYDWVDDAEVWYWYDFRPAIGVNVPECDCLSINHVTGKWTSCDYDGEAIERGTITVTFEKNAP